MAHLNRARARHGLDLFRSMNAAQATKEGAERWLDEQQIMAGYKDNGPA